MFFTQIPPIWFQKISDKISFDPQKKRAMPAFGITVKRQCNGNDFRVIKRKSL